LTSKKEHFYIQRIAELEKQVADLMEQVAKLTDKVAKLSKNSSNSSKPPSSDIIKPPKAKQADGPRRQGGQSGHKGFNRQPFGPNRIDKTIPIYAHSCDCGYKGHGQPLVETKIHGLCLLYIYQISHLPVKGNPSYFQNPSALFAL